MNDQTMADVPWGPRHRSLTIKKVENGYVIDAAFIKQGKPDDYDRTEMRHFVFYTLPELLDFARGYLDAPKEKLQS